MNISLNLSEILDTHTTSAIFSIHTVATELEIPFFIIGAMARDIILTYGFNIPPMRATNDIDFAVQVESWAQLDRLKRKLIETGDYKASRDIHRLLLNNVFPVDIVPYGALSDSYSIAWPPDYDVTMSVEGFHESFQNSIGVNLQNEPPIVVQVASLEGLALLKIISWDENPNIRNKDAVDLFIIMNNYIDAGNEDRFYSEIGELVDKNDKFNQDYDTLSAIFLGRTIAMMLNNSLAIKQKVIDILNRETTTNRVKGLIQTIVTSGSFPQYSYEQVEKMFLALHHGVCYIP
jgi:predicted nucleotidyltransferase